MSAKYVLCVCVLKQKTVTNTTTITTNIELVAGISEGVAFIHICTYIHVDMFINCISMFYRKHSKVAI